jgi:prolyl oligopeptidase
VKNARAFTRFETCVALAAAACLVHCGSEPPPAPPPPPLVVPVASTAAPEGPKPPPTPRRETSAVIQGTTVSDPYQWLEGDSDPAVHSWADAQNAYARGVLDGLPERAAVRARAADLLTSRSANYGDLLWRKGPRGKGGVLFAIENRPPKQQSFLVALPSADAVGAERTILDPNTLDPSGKTAIDFYVPSRDGQLVAVSLSHGGSESGDVHVYESATGKERFEVIQHVNGGTAGGSLAWNADGTGFYYTRYPHEGERPAEDLDFYQQVWFHMLGKPPETDRYELGKDAPRIAEIELQASADGKYVLATIQKGDGGEYELFLHGVAGGWVQVSQYEDKVLRGELGEDGKLYLLSRKDAPHGKIVRTPLAHPSLSSAETVVPASEVVIEQFTPAHSRLYVVDLVGGPSQVRVLPLATKGGAPSVVPILPVSAVGQIARLEGDDVLYQNQSFMNPPGWYAYSPTEGASRPTALHETSNADFSDSEVVRETCVSKDGTNVPLSVLRKKGTLLDGNNPTLLYAYGGYGVNQTPRFRPSNRIWLEAGGVYAVANLRGGGELGEAWHDAGKLTHKQNVFDDFYACAQHLVEEKVTSPSRLAILGGSNGGLLMGAELVQHPSMYKAVVSRVGIYDMIRVELTANGAFNTTEFGTVKDPEQFKALFAYSPYHHVKDGTAYPAVLMMTGSNDPRVSPWHSRKMVAALQAATSSKEPVLLRLNGDTGHGLATPLSEEIEEQADIFAFLFHELGVGR